MTRVHLIGIGGSGLSAIARLLKESGYDVTGSDRELTPFAADLQKMGIQVHIGHDAENVTGANMVLRSSAITDDNPEVLAAFAAGIPVYKRSDFLGQLMVDKLGIAVAGTHGKTTTTAMIAWVLSVLGRDPSFIVGGVMNNYGVNARAGQGSAFVIEADEYDRMFLGLKPRIEVITNLEHDHPDCFPTLRDMVQAFEEFTDLLPEDGTLIVSGDDDGAAALLPRIRKSGRNTISFSLQSELTINSPSWIQAQNLQPHEGGGYSFSAASNIGGSFSQPVEVKLQVPGLHNVRNALATLAVAAVMGLSLKNASSALGEFRGTGRRFQVLGEKNGVLVIDDYAHHPTEIRATLAAARATYPGRKVWAVWQPHTYSRTRALAYEFSNSFGDADEVLITEVYAAREPKQDFTSAEIVSSMPHTAAHFTGTLPNTTLFLLERLKSGDVLIVLSAGDANRVSRDVLAGL